MSIDRITEISQAIHQAVADLQSQGAISMETVTYLNERMQHECRATGANELEIACACSLAAVAGVSESVRDPKRRALLEGILGGCAYDERSRRLAEKASKVGGDGS